jgi:TolA-binding protein
MLRQILAVCLLASSISSAEGEKKDKPSHDAELKKKESSGPATNLAGNIERKKTESGKAAPAMNYDTFRVGVENQVAGKRRDQIDQLKQIIDVSRKDKKEMPTLLFRLGELYWEESQYYFFEANRKDDDYIRAMNAGDQAGQERAKKEKEDLLAQQKDAAKQATDAYSEIVQKYKDFERTDEVLYFLGKNLMDMGDEKKALIAYKRLTEKYTKSKYLPDAWMAFGEYYFNNSKAKKDVLDKALDAYKKAAGFPDSHVYSFAIYKMGWCYFNLTDYEKAMDQFKAVVLYAKINGTQEVEGEKGKKNSKSGLVREARGDFVRSYARLATGKPDEGKQRFQALADSPDDLRVMMTQLANLYYEDGKDKEAALAYNMLIIERPTAPQAPGFQSHIIDCVLRAGNKQMTVQQVRRLVKIVTDVKAANQKLSDKDKQEMDAANELAERILSNLAVTWHNECRKTRDEECYKFANDVYGDYLTLFPDNNKAYDLRFFWAELLNDNLNKYDQSSQEYTKVLLQDIKRIETKDEKGNPGKPGKFMVNAAFNAILANEEVIKKSPPPPPDIKDPNKPVEIAPVKKALLEACERYIKYVPGTDKKVEIQYKAARIYYEYNHLDEAVTRFADITLNYPDHKFEDGSKPCTITGNLIIDAYNIRGDTDKMNEWSCKLTQSKCAEGNGEFKTDMFKLCEQTTFKKANALDTQKEYLKASDAYMSFIKSFPTSELADKALFNAAIDFYNGKMLDKAIETRKKLLTDYKKSTYVPSTMFALAEGYEATADFEQACTYYEQYADAYEKSKTGKGGAAAPKKAAPAPKKGKKGEEAKAAPAAPAGEQIWEEPKAKIAIFNSGVFRDGLGNYKKALANRDRYLKLWPDDKDNEAIMLSIVDLHERNHAYKQATDALEDYERKFAKDPNKILTAEGRIQGIFEEKLKNKAQAGKICKRVLDYYKTVPDKKKKDLEIAALDPVGRCNYQDNEDDFKKYTGVKLKWSKLQNVGELKQSIKDKSKALEEITKLYTATVKLKSADPAICALYKIGLSYEQFYDQLIKPPVPKGVPEDLLAEIEAQFRDQADPIKAKAAEAFAAAVQKSNELDSYNKCTVDSLNKLRDKFKPEAYPPMPEDTLEIKVTGGASMAIGNDLLTAIQPTLKAAEGLADNSVEGSTRGVNVKDNDGPPADLEDAPPPKNNKKTIADNPPQEEKKVAGDGAKKDNAPPANDSPAPAPKKQAPPAKKGGGDEPEDAL